MQLRYLGTDASIALHCQQVTRIYNTVADSGVVSEMHVLTLFDTIIIDQRTKRPM